ncbi:MAG: hypothetical protein WDN69_10235 [Aliidongia sp.]
MPDGPHVGLALEDHGIGHRLAVRGLTSRDLDDICLTREFRFADQLEPIVGRGGEAGSCGKGKAVANANAPAIARLRIIEITPRSPSAAQALGGRENNLFVD